MNRLYSIPSRFEAWLQNQYFPERNLVWFRRCVYAMLLLKMLFLWPVLSDFYDYEIGRSLNYMRPETLYLAPVFHNYYHIVWGLGCITVAAAVFLRKNLLLSVVVFIICLNCFTITEAADNNSDKLLRSFAFALIFLTEGTGEGTTKRLLNNAVVFLLKVYFCLFYFLNAYGKMIVPMWQDGSCMQDVWTLAYFVNDRMVPNWFFNPVVAFITAWSVMLFEMLFAFLIWFRPFKKWFLIAGVFFHLGIALFLSLPDFSLTVLIAYILFIEPKRKSAAVAIS